MSCSPEKLIVCHHRTAESIVRGILIFLLLVYSTGLSAQELFPLNEPASTMPRNVLGVRAFSQHYKEVKNQHRNLYGLRMMYGLTPKLTVMVGGTVSNHHSKSLPPDFPDHNTPQVGVPLPYRFNGLNFYAKYRFYTHDAQNRHLRLAAWAQYSHLNVAHDEGEPNLQDDTRGFGAGLIGTYLYRHFAVSFNGGLILPSEYKGDVPDILAGLPSVPARVVYGKAWQYNLSFGYLLLPQRYSSYRQTNINLYLELLGKSYDGAKVYFENIGMPGSAYEVTGLGKEVLSRSYYVEAHPGIQAIIRSNLRIDLSVGFPVIRKSYAHYYPLWSLGIQRYFYFNRKK